MTSDLLMFAASDSGGAEIKAAIIGGIVGSLVGGGFSVLAAWQAHKHNLSLEQKQAHETIDGILHAIRIEWSVMLKEFDWLGERLNEVKDGQGFTYFFKITKNYFIVYPNNTSIVGQIADSELCRQIVTAYTRANTFMDAIEVNNENERRLREFETHATTSTMYDINNHRQRMADFVPHLKQSFQELKAEAGKLAKAIDDYRQKHPVPSNKQ